MKVDFSKLPEADVLLDAIEGRLSKGLGTTTLFIGLSGTGKSSQGLRVLEKYQERRKEKTGKTPKIYITDSTLTCIKAVLDSDPEDAIQIEELSSLFPSRRAMSADNLSIGKVFDTIRKKRLVIVANAPIFGSIDSHIRSMSHFLVETLRINKTQGVVISKFHRLQTNPSTGKTYRHTMQRNGRDVSRMFTFMPSKERWDNYEEQKDKFMHNLYSKLLREQEKKLEKENKELSKQNTNIRVLSKREIEVHQLFFRKGMKQKEIAEKLGVDQSRISRIIKNIIKKSENTKENSQNDGTKDKEAAVK